MPVTDKCPLENGPSRMQARIETNDPETEWGLSRGSSARGSLPVHIHTFIRGHVTVLEVFGDIDASAFARLCSAAEDLQAAMLTFAAKWQTDIKIGIIVLDLRRVSFFPIAGLSVLADIYRAYHRQYRMVLIVRENSQPERVLMLSRFHLAFRMIRRPFLTVEKRQSPWRGGVGTA